MLEGREAKRTRGCSDAPNVWNVGNVGESPKGNVGDSPKGNVGDSPKGNVGELPKGNVGESLKGSDGLQGVLPQIV